MNLRAGFLVLPTLLILGAGCAPKEERVRTVYVTVPAPATPVAAMTPPPAPYQAAQPVQPPAPLPVRQASGLTPADLEYLRWFKQFDQMTLEMMARNIRNAAIPREQREQNGSGEAQVREWRQVATVFRQRTPPANCQSIAAAYSQRLDAIASSTQALSGASLEELMKLKQSGNSSQQIDVATSQVNAALGQCLGKAGDLAGLQVR
ncbi:MAG: hypothetical protein V4671_23475 [Armatimonadota bacterium]